ncbi:bifunctional riboflavin kinase/FAD synthetase [Heliorestis acidaminivorans]|uniref:Riboflavin biosynthesis protein n=1 Tax=Heliorestis acidaminivorans TaxID=553427 RepID=A0A6I0F9Y0_9FIRM|nr:bifunctional riboflavin kinase/FAD synthetase [Heliorestis acidaminivorans]KAB2954348.1 bifunctional riboflavin kinase/FAD synthetase [Heliorestis acidaminivorans]
MDTIIYKGRSIGEYQRVHIALGNFDGVHLGHRRIIEELVKKSHQEQGTAVVATFDPHPLEVIRPQQPPKLITPMKVKGELFRRLGVDICLLFSFSDQMAQLTAEDFVEIVLKEHLRCNSVMIGFNYSFGSKGLGTPTLLQKLGKENGFNVKIMDAVTIDGIPVSSTNIRKALLQGDVERATQLLGYIPMLTGKVVHGEKRGRQMGFPTINLDLSKNQLLPQRGVYSAVATFADKKDRYIALVNIGVKPTFGCHRESVEAHLLDFRGDLYGQEVILHLIHFLRPEIAFGQVEELIAQIKKDSTQTREYMKRIDQEFINEKLIDLHNRSTS